MTEDPTAPRLQRARLGNELRRLRRLAGISGREIARSVRVGQATVSRIENAQTVPSLPEVTAWADAVGAPEETRRSLLVLAEAALNEVETWRVRQRGGLPAMQADIRTLEASARTTRHFQPTLVPGLLQTAEYARRVFELVDVVGGGDYVAAVAARMERQQVLFDRTRHFEFLITEAALRWRPGPSHVLAAQLDRVASVATLGNVSLGLIPVDTKMRAIPWCGFDLYEDLDHDGQPFVMLETAHAGLTVSDASDVALYRDQLQLIRAAALFGDEAAGLLEKITDDVRSRSDQ